MRKQAQESSEMVSQLIFGDIVYGLEQGSGNWVRVRNLDDEYEGWVNPLMLTELEPETLARFQHWKYVIHNGAEWELPDQSRIHLPLGARIPELPSGTDDFEVGDKYWKCISRDATIAIQPIESASTIARYFLNTPYLWGGKSGFGIDCSGLTQMVYRICGLALSRDSSDQINEGRTIPFDTRKPGDLAFFSHNEKDNVSHVGIVVENEGILHSSGKVRIDRLTDAGIIHRENGRLTHKFISINRYF